MATLVNGNGNAAVYAQQDADLYTGIEGNSTKILNVGSKLAATIEDSNTIAVADGVILTKEGRRIQVDVGNIDEFIIPTGQAGTTRYYIFGYHLYTDGSANQKCETFVQLMSNGSETITENTFRNGFNEVYVSLYRVKQDGLNLNTPAALLSIAETMADIIEDIDGINASLTEKVAQHSDTTYSAVKGLGYDETGKKLGLVISQGGADTVIPFSGGGYPFYKTQYYGNSKQSVLIYQDGEFSLASNLSNADFCTYLINNCDFVSSCTYAGSTVMFDVTIAKNGYYTDWNDPDAPIVYRNTGDVVRIYTNGASNWMMYIGDTNPLA